MDGQTLLLYDDAMLEHSNFPGHPERPDRLRAIRRALVQADFQHVRWVSPSPADEAKLLAVHAREHVDELASLRGRTGLLDPETGMSPGSHEAACLAAGAGLDAVAALMSGEAANAFALVRPPGHHACRDHAMGFCLLNNIAIAAADAVASHGCERVLIVDWDAHHGNGTQEMFYERRDVLLVSIHQAPFWPGTGSAGETGAGAGEGFTVNLPLPAGRSDADYLAVFRHIVAPIADAYRPQLVLVSAGFDAHVDDPLADMCLTTGGFATLLDVVRGIAERHAGGRLALFLEGGYELRALADSVCACVAGLAPGHEGAPAPVADLRGDQETLLREHARCWPCLREG